MNIDTGEAGAIALAIDLADSLLIIDDMKGRKTAEHFGIKFIGSLGVIVEAKRNGFISSIKPVMKKIRETNFRLNDRLERMVYELAGETK